MSTGLNKKLHTSRNIDWFFRYSKENVMNRDRNRCVKCNSIKSLTVHHIKPVSKYPQFAYDEENMMTLCEKCHIEIHKGDKR